MENKDFDTIFKELDFDIAEPYDGHKSRFQQKLEGRSSKVSSTSKIRSLLAPILSIAAAVALVVLFAAGFLNSENTTADLASISPEMKQTQNFYSGLIEQELNLIEAQKSPETEKIINDALSQMNKLENEYNKLRKDLTTSGKDKRVIYAMISNFQQRIDLLENVMQQIDNIKTLNNQDHENNII